MSKTISVVQAIDTILDSISPLGETTIRLEDALGLVLAENLRARDDVPFEANSAMDGYAVRSMDLAAATPSNPVELRLLPDAIYAGRGTLPLAIAVSQGAAARIMTGAVIPPGSDAVVPQESVRLANDRLAFSEPAAEGDHIRPAGEDMKAGEEVLAKGQVIDPAAIGVAVLAGAAKFRVFRRPKIAVFTSGDELIKPGAEMKSGLVRDSNSVVLKALLAELGCEVVDLGIARDSREDILERVAMAARADAIISSGGVSVGDRDLIREVLEGQGLKMKFWGVDVKPGKPLLFGMLGDVPVFGLPGNPVSTHITFELFVRPAIRKMQGRRRIFRPVVSALLATSVRRRPGRPEFMRARLERTADGILARLTKPEQGSGVFSSVLNADGLLFVSSDTISIPAGERVSCLDFWGKEEVARDALASLI